MKERESKAWEPTRLRERKKDRKKREEELGLRGTLFHSQYGVRSRRKKTAKKRAKGKGACPGIVCW